MDRSVNNKGSIFSQAFGGLNYYDKIDRPDLVIDVPCTLAELYKGAAKSVKYEKKVHSLYYIGFKRGWTFIIDTKQIKTPINKTRIRKINSSPLQIIRK